MIQKYKLTECADIRQVFGFELQVIEVLQHGAV